MARLFLALISASLFIGALASGAQACGPSTDCKVEGDRFYRVKLPSSYDPAVPAGVLIFVHGWRGTMAAAMDNARMIAVADRLGVILVAVKSKLEGWSLEGRPGGKVTEIDEIAYFDAVLADLSQRFAVAPKRRLVAGFSGGGMMVWTLACQRSQAFAAFIPIAGTFWAPVPKTCPSPPANILHIHGDRDPVVPLSGRAIRDAKQGDVLEAVGNYAVFGRYGRRPALPQLPALACKHRANAEGRTLSFCLFPGGHAWNAGFIAAGWQFFEATGALPRAASP
jgi:polyhydroxybutyrate depolymerase